MQSPLTRIFVLPACAALFSIVEVLRCVAFIHAGVLENSISCDDDGSGTPGLLQNSTGGFGSVPEEETAAECEASKRKRWFRVFTPEDEGEHQRLGTGAEFAAAAVLLAANLAAPVMFVFKWMFVEAYCTELDADMTAVEESGEEEEEESIKDAESSKEPKKTGKGSSAGKGSSRKGTTTTSTPASSTSSSKRST